MSGLPQDQGTDRVQVSQEEPQQGTVDIAVPQARAERSRTKAELEIRRRLGGSSNARRVSWYMFETLRDCMNDATLSIHCEMRGEKVFVTHRSRGHREVDLRGREGGEALNVVIEGGMREPLLDLLL